MKKSLSRQPIEEESYMSDRKSSTSTPRWVKVSGIVAIILVILAVAIMLISGGEHGPGRHFKSGDAGSHTPLIEQWMQQL